MTKKGSRVVSNTNREGAFTLSFANAANLQMLHIEEAYESILPWKFLASDMTTLDVFPSLL